MEQIKSNDAKTEERPKSYGEVIEQSTAKKKKLVRSAINYIGTAVAMFIIFVAIVVSTTDLTIMTTIDWAELGLSFFVFMFCAYAMYVNGTGSGIRAGRKSEAYLASKKQYDDLKDQIIKNKMQGRLPEFCRYYIEEELRNTRNAILTEVGIDFSVYQARYIGKDKEDLQRISVLTKSQIEAILEANRVKPIRLTPEMILKRGRGSLSRSPLGVEPSKKRRIGYAVKFGSTFILAVLLVVVTLKPKADLTWATIAEIILKLFPIVLNGFLGYQSGYENIFVDTVNYMNDQSDLMRQLIRYAEDNPIAKSLVSAAEVFDIREYLATKEVQEAPPEAEKPPSNPAQAKAQ